MKKNVVVRRVRTRREIDDFISLPKRLYKGNPCYVPDLDFDLKLTLKSHVDGSSPSNVHTFMQPFVAYDANGRVVGRVVALINEKANDKWSTRQVRFSQIEFVDDPQVSRALLRSVELWGSEHGMNEVVGPLGISDFDKEGMLVSDFDKLGSVITYYNPAYYPRHMEALGYRKIVDWLQLRLPVPDELPPVYHRVAGYCRSEAGLTVRKITNRDVLRRGYGRRIFQLFNQCYAPLFGFSEFDVEQMDKYIRHYVYLVDKRLLTVIEDKAGEIVGAAVTMGSLSHAMQKSHGRLLPMGWWHLLKTVLWKHEDTIEMLLVAVRPDYQDMGVTALFFEDLLPQIQSLGFKYIETGPQLESNVKEINQWSYLKPTIEKRRRCYAHRIETGCPVKLESA